MCVQSATSKYKMARWPRAFCVLGLWFSVCFSSKIFFLRIVVWRRRGQNHHPSFLFWVPCELDTDAHQPMDHSQICLNRPSVCKHFHNENWSAPQKNSSPSSLTRHLTIHGTLHRHRQHTCQSKMGLLIVRSAGGPFSLPQIPKPGPLVHN